MACRSSTTVSKLSTTHAPSATTRAAFARLSVALAVLALAAGGCGNSQRSDVDRTPQTNLPRGSVTLAGKAFEVQIANTEATRRKGYMFTTNIPENTGMIFAFRKPGSQSFWNRNVPIALDLLYIRSDGANGWAIDSIVTMPPLVETSFPSATNRVRFALELRQGTAAALGVKAGDPIILDQSILTAADTAE